MRHHAYQRAVINQLSPSHYEFSSLISPDFRRNNPKIPQMKIKIMTKNIDTQRNN